MGSCFYAITGVVSYCDRYSDGMKRVLKTFGPVPEFSGATVEKVNQVCGLPRGMQAGTYWPSVGGALSVAAVLTLGSDGHFFLTAHSCILVSRIP